ncbi:hypothetical protein ACFQ49_07750 [Kroppenstedtia eburnea]|uniref:Uncharacterized protein n=1 Tax=Kroppenstedtia eburnea TaxID=714067 RepID=A0A1N7M278_9BACL|nr:hypothetical protein [Kroppenstedtia eburnea]EGK14815.1 hypothetical protein HMPREF9374_0101 [Desmospora sp. 8437]QKI81791.1 hypothetical protein GXN75_07140 [Kroppenstedtia eburnea]SIS80226.1 hypothetical protein SAMN05421790_105154 [Kroppenstedtia eburnea]
MAETYSLRLLRGRTKNRIVVIPFEEAWLSLEMPGPFNLKSWSVTVTGIEASGAEFLDNCYYYGDRTLTLEMETSGGKRLGGTVRIRSVAVGPQARAVFDGAGFLDGFESL